MIEKIYPWILIHVCMCDDPSDSNQTSVCTDDSEGRPFRVGEKHFWGVYNTYMECNHPEKTLFEERYICGKCHLQVKKSAGLVAGSKRLCGNYRGVEIESGGVGSESAGLQSESGGVQSESGGVQSESGGVQSESGGAENESEGRPNDCGGVYSDSAQAFIDSTRVNEENSGISPFDEPRVTLHYEELESMSLGIDISGNSESVVTLSTEQGCSEASAVSEASTVYVFKNILTVGASERRCMICQNPDGRSRIPKKVLWNVWVDKQILIPAGNRSCSSHLMKSRFTPDAIDKIEATKLGVKMTGEELGNWILGVTKELGNSKPIKGLMDGNLDTETYKMLFGLEKKDFENLFETYVRDSEMRNSSCRHKKEALGMMLMMLRKNLDQDMIAFVFECSQSVVSDAIDAITTLLNETFVPRHLGYDAISREEAIRLHNRSILHDLLELQPDELAVIADGTYIYIEQPMNLEDQRLLYSGQKGRPLTKIMVLGFGSGHIWNVVGPFGSNGGNNDATIMQQMLLETELTAHLKPNDKLIVDRGFRNCEGEMQAQGYGVFMLEMLRKDQAQFETFQANKTRLVTKNRWVIESINGRLKNVFKFFKHTVEGSYTPKIILFIRVACALFNCYFKDIQKEKPEHKKMAAEMLQRVNLVNSLQTDVVDKGLEGRLLVANWKKASVSEDDLEDFPRLYMEDLEAIMFGEYQLRIGARYVHQHMSETGEFEFHYYKHEDLGGKVVAVKMQSRFRSAVRHLMCVRYDPDKVGVDAITGMYCKCQVGSRTVGSCSHIAGILRYLSHDRHQEAQPTRRRAPLGIIDAKARVNAIMAQRRN